MHHAPHRLRITRHLRLDLLLHTLDLAFQPFQMVQFLIQQPALVLRKAPIQRQAAWAATHTKEHIFVGLLPAHADPQRTAEALIALAHHMITIVFNVLVRGAEHVELGGDYFDRSNRPKVVSRLVTRLTKLGYYVNLQPVDSEPSE